MKYLLTMVVMLAGCMTTIDTGRGPPPDWPELEIVVMRVSEATARYYCPAGFMQTVYACTIPSFADGRCLIYLASDSPSILEHEKLHCKGYDHRGESAARDSWAKWKAR